MSKLNIELFRKIRDRIAEIPESYDQAHWCNPSDKAPCGTVACLAGEAIICAAPTVEAGIEELKALFRRDKYYAVPSRAAGLLGLEGDWAAFLDEDDAEAGGETVIFDPEASCWPFRYGKAFHAGNKAGAAVAYLDHIIETGKVFD